MSMSNKKQKMQKAQKRFFAKVMLISFYFLMICYSQCGYAVIKEYLKPGTIDLYKLGTKDSRIRINTMELATEVATYLKNGRLCEVYLQLPEPGEQDNIRQLILKALYEALQNNTALTALDLQYNQIGDEGTRALAEMLRNNTVLTVLNLESNQIGDEGAKGLAEALRINTALTTLELGGNQISAEGAKALAEVLRNNTALTTLCLRDNRIGAAGARALAETLRSNMTLTTLDLEGNEIGAAGARALAVALRNNTALTTLDLTVNQIGDKGARALAEVLRNNVALTTLNLVGNQIGVEGARAIAEALGNNTTLKTLYLMGNEIGAEGVRVLAEALRDNTVLATLHLGVNQIGAEGARALAEALRNNTALTTLNFWGNEIGAEGARALAAALADNYTLLEVINDNGDANEKPLLRNHLLLQLLRKIKRASSFTFTIGCCHTSFGLEYLLPYILDLAGLNVRNRTAFENIQNYNTAGIRDTIFKGSLEEVIRLFYYGSVADYGEILREVNQIRRLQREILQENQRAIPQGLIELPEELPLGAVLNMTQEERVQQRRDFVTTTFWSS